MRVHVFQHEAFEALAGIEPWLKVQGATINYTRFYISADVPALDSFDWLIVMGGPMSVNDEATLPWLTAEREVIAKAIASGKTVLGICLGAQLIAKALGGQVTRNREKEIGWFPVSRVDGAQAHPLGACFPAKTEVFQWHGETFSIPNGAVHLLRSEACEHQAFAFGPRVLGLQFHLETTEPSLREMLIGDGDSLGSGRYIQTEAEMLNQSGRFIQLNELLVRVLDALLAAK